MSLETNILYLFFTGYLFTFLLEVLRTWSPSKVRAFYPISIAVFAIILHAVYLAMGVWQSKAVTPLTNWHDWFSLVAWILATSYLYLNYHHRNTVVGVILMPMVIILTIATWYTERSITEQVSTNTISLWGWVHAFALLVGTVVVFLGFVAGVMYLLQVYQLKHKTPPNKRFRLPSLEWLERINSRSVKFSVVMLTIGVVSGFFLNASHKSGLEHQPLLQWSDPVVWSSGVLLVWIIAITFFELFYRPARQGQKVAYLTVGSFIFLVVVLAVALLTADQHPASTSKTRKSLATKSNLSFYWLTDSGQRGGR